jgi:hypothetical protein
MIESRFQRKVVNGCPFLAVQTHVPAENLVVCNSNKLVTVLRVTDAVQVHVITSALPAAYCALMFNANRSFPLIDSRSTEQQSLLFHLRGLPLRWPEFPAEFLEAGAAADANHAPGRRALAARTRGN